jgi:pyrroline-5-carboxylate reductase
MDYELGIIGAGNMAEAIARGVLRAGRIPPSSIIASDISPQRRDLFQSQLGIKSVEDNLAAARNSRILLLSVKPQQMGAALAGIGAAIDPNTLIISIAAAITSLFIEKNLGAGRAWRVVRSMPNTPMLVGAGIVAISAGKNATPADMALARQIFESAATVVETTEDKMDAVTALSGSGPAYFFYLAEQMIRAGVELSLSPEEARQLVVATAAGAAKMLADSGDSPADLRRKVTSPGGTTQAAIAHLDENFWPLTTIDAVKAAARRSKELSS